MNFPDDIIKQIGIEPYHVEPAGVIYCGDCLKILPKMAEKSVDLVVTDPPYGIGKAEWDADFLFEWMIPASRTCRAMAIMPGIWNILKMPQRIGDLNFKWMIAAHLINGMTRSAIGWGNFIPCLVYVREGYSVHAQSSDIKDVVVGRQLKPDHPSPKPLEAILWFVDRLMGDTVCDPFLGSGTTVVAAKQLGRKFIGIEINEDYCKIARQRLAQGVLL